jgi:hypothetical protein
MKSRIWMATLISSAILFGVGQAAPQTPAKSYWGWDRTDRVWHDVAPYQVQVGVLAYYRVHERWPATWADVVASQIWQVPLLGLNNEVIDPDDKQFQFWGDVHYDSTKVPPRIMVLEAPGTTPQHRSITLEKPQTYREVFAWIDSLPKSNTQVGSFKATSMLEDKNLLTQFAILHAMHFTIAQYRDIHGMLPMNLGELAKSGLGPINSKSINPVTGRAFVGDGSPGDIVFKYNTGDSSAGTKPLITLNHVPSRGSPMPVWFTY